MKNKTQNAQKVLVRVVNECLRAGVLALAPQDRKVPASQREFEMAGVTTGEWAGVMRELSVNVTLWPTELGREMADAILCGPQKLRDRGGFLAHTWLDRTGRPRLAMRGDNLTVYCEKPREADIEAMPWEEPQGFEVGNRVHT